MKNNSIILSKDMLRTIYENSGPDGVLEYLDKDLYQSIICSPKIGIESVSCLLKNPVRTDMTHEVMSGLEFWDLDGIISRLANKKELPNAIYIGEKNNPFKKAVGKLWDLAPNSDIKKNVVLDTSYTILKSGVMPSVVYIVQPDIHQIHGINKDVVYSIMNIVEEFEYMFDKRALINHLHHLIGQMYKSNIFYQEVLNNLDRAISTVQHMDVGFNDNAKAELFHYLYSMLLGL